MTIVCNPVLRSHQRNTSLTQIRQPLETPPPPLVPTSVRCRNIVPQTLSCIFRPPFPCAPAVTFLKIRLDLQY